VGHIHAHTCAHRAMPVLPVGMDEYFNNIDDANGGMGVAQARHRTGSFSVLHGRTAGVYKYVLLPSMLPIPQKLAWHVHTLSL